MQCDVDIFGIKEPEADAEIIATAVDLFKALGFKKFQVRLNDRSIFKDSPYEVIVAIDKLAKIGKEGVIEEIIKKGYSREEATQKLNNVFEAKPTETINRIFAYLKSLGIPEEFYSFDPTIARSFSYSNGPIFEVVVADYTGGSLLGGERYDGLVARFSKNDVPATGYAISLDRITDAMTDLNLFPNLISGPQVLVTVFSPQLLPESLKAASKLRSEGIKTDIYVNVNAKLDKQLKYADRLGIPYVIVIGPDEAQQAQLQLKNLKTREQKQMKIEEVIETIKGIQMV